jgi:hypothetical protein
MIRIGLVLCAAACFFAIEGAKAEDDTKAVPLDPKLEARLAAEKEARKACKTDICKAFAERKGGGAISCEATKTWPDEEIATKILAGYVSWPWGHATCTSQINLDRDAVAKAMSDPEAKIKLAKHTLKCLVDKKGGEGKEADSYVLKFSIAPEISFKNGKATDVKLNWSEVDAPALLKGAVWSATTLDKTFDVLGGQAAKRINAFVYERCKEVGVEIPEKK